MSLCAAARRVHSWQRARYLGPFKIQDVAEEISRNLHTLDVSRMTPGTRLSSFINFANAVFYCGVLDRGILISRFGVWNVSKLKKQNLIIRTGFAKWRSQSDF